MQTKHYHSAFNFYRLTMFIQTRPYNDVRIIRQQHQTVDNNPAYRQNKAGTKVHASIDRRRSH